MRKPKTQDGDAVESGKHTVPHREIRDHIVTDKSELKVKNGVVGDAEYKVSSGSLGRGGSSPVGGIDD